MSPLGQPAKRRLPPAVRLSIAASLLLVLPLCLAAPPAQAGAVWVLDDGLDPCWSPTGESFLCSRPSPDWDDHNMQIWLVPFGGAPAQVTHDPDGAFLPLWLPDGQRFVYFHYSETAQSAEFTVHELGVGPVARWTAPTAWDDPGFFLSPDASEVLYSKGPGGTAALNLTTGAIRDVHANRGGAISPDGQWIAFILPGDTLAVQPLGGGPVTRLGYGGYHAWTRDSRFLVYTGMTGSGQFDIFVVGRDGNARKQLTHDPEIEWLKCVSPSGAQVIYSKSLEEFAPLSVWIADLEFPTPVRATTWGAIKQTYR